MPVYVQAIYFIGLLGGLVFVHEFGHFLAAKFFNVKVLTFSLGFGTRMWGFKRGDTEYQIAAIPLGGYVKMAGTGDPSDPSDRSDRGRGFIDQKPYKRAIIKFAGPAVNLFLPFVIFCGLNMVPQQKDPPIIGIVLPNEAGERAGLQSGDRVQSVDGQPIRSFEEMREEIEARPGKAFDVVVDRQGQQLTLHVTPSTEADKNLVETTSKGRIGVIGSKIPAYVGVVTGSRVYEAGLRTFDRITDVNGTPITSEQDLKAALKKAGDGALSLTALREHPEPKPDPNAKPTEPKPPSQIPGDTLKFTIAPGAGPLGIDRPDLYVQEVLPDSKLYADGMRPGDKIVAIDGTPVVSGMRLGRLLDDKVNAGQKSIKLTIERGTTHLDVTCEPKIVEHRDQVMGPENETVYGFYPHPRIYFAEPYSAAEKVTVQYGLIQAMHRSFTQTVSMTRSMVLGLVAMVRGNVSTQHLRSIGMLWGLSGVAAESGFTVFLGLFAAISINLGLMNLLPIPVLDGFEIVISAMEGISRRPVPMRARIVAEYVGLVLVVLIMLVGLKNDIVFGFKL